MKSEKKELKKTLKSKDKKSNSNRKNMKDSQKINFKMKEIESILSLRTTGERKKMSFSTMRMKRINHTRLSLRKYNKQRPN